MTKFEYLYCAAMANSAICTGNATERQLNLWFGHRSGITREEIVSRQAEEFALVALAYLNKSND